MASLYKDPKGNRQLQFRNPVGERKIIYLGRLPLRQAQTVKSKVECLIATSLAGDTPDDHTAAWLTRIPAGLRQKLAVAGLMKPRNETTLAKLLADFVKAHPHVAPSTVVAWRQVARNLLSYLDGNSLLRSIGRREAEGFRQWLIDRGLAASTIQKRLRFARQMFRYAVRCEWIEKNPFEGISHRSGNPRERQHYISIGETLRLIEAAPNWVWRTIIALARFGGLRCPSEVLSLRLADLGWDRGRVIITSPKTGTRTMPMFARLRPYLEQAWDMAVEGQTNVIPEGLYLPAAYGPRGWTGCNLRTTFQKIVIRAGLDVWPRLFQNLRASCESDLVREYPISTVCSWLGNTVSVAARHYVQVTDADFERACCRGEKTWHLARRQSPTLGPAASRGELPNLLSLGNPENSALSEHGLPVRGGLEPAPKPPTQVDISDPGKARSEANDAAEPSTPSLDGPVKPFRRAWRP